MQLYGKREKQPREEMVEVERVCTCMNPDDAMICADIATPTTDKGGRAAQGVDGKGTLL